MAKHSAHSMAQTGANSRALKISAWLTGVYFLIEMTIGIYTGSISVISDAFHTFSAVGGVVLALVAARIARRPADELRTYGSLRAEIIGALLNGAFLCAMALVVLVMGFMRLRNPIELPTAPMLLAAFGGLITEIISLRLLYSGQKGDLNVKGAFWHVVQTFVGSLLIIVAALVIRFTGFYAIDPILGMAFGFVLLYASWGIMAEAISILMEGTPEGIDIKRAIAQLEALPEVEDVHHVHAWTLTSNVHVFSAHIVTGDAASAPGILREANELLRRDFGFHLSTLQLETECLDEQQANALDFLMSPILRKNVKPVRHSNH